MAGEFDALPAGTGLLICDPDTRIFGSTTSALLSANLKQLGTQGSATEFFGVALAQEWFALHRHGVAAFAGKRNLAPPTWWKKASGQKQAEPGRATPQVRRGRAPAASWDALAEAIKVECELRGAVPYDPDGPQEWQTQADVERWTAAWLERRQETAGESTIRDHVRAILGDLKRTENQN
jgi:LPS sulfotransferase NodH